MSAAISERIGRKETSAAGETKAEQVGRQDPRLVSSNAADSVESATTDLHVNLFAVERLADTPDGPSRDLGYVPAELLEQIASIAYAPGSYLLLEWSGPAAERESFVRGLPAPDWSAVGEWLLTKSIDGDVGMVDLLDAQRRHTEEIEYRGSDEASAMWGAR